MGSDIDRLLDEHDATAVAAAIRSGEVDAAEVMAVSIARAEERNPALNAFVSTRFDQAAQEAAALDRDAPFAGVPFVVKDLAAQVAGLPHTRGSRLFADDVSQSDSELVRRYRAAGLIILGTTNAPELGLNASTEPSLNGPTRNPHGLDHSTGGSSGGTAAAVAAGIVPVGHGNDGGGSIRIPSSACGLFGLKPSRGRVSAHPAATLLADPMGCHHVLARSVRDSAALLDLTAGAMPGDPYEIARPSRPWVEEVGASPGLLRIAMVLTAPGGEVAHPECVAAVEATAATLSELGHEVVEADPPWSVEQLMIGMSSLMATPMAVEVDARLAQLGRGLADDDLEPFSRVLYDSAAGTTGKGLVTALVALEEMARSMGEFMIGHDLLLSPTLAQPTPPLGYLDTSNIEAMFERAATYSAFTSPFNITGQPAASLPLTVGSNGMPIGVQLVAPFGREDRLIAVSSQVEAAHPWPVAPAWPARSEAGWPDYVESLAHTTVSGTGGER